MCWAEYCCFFVRLDLGCILLAMSSFVLSTATSVISLVYLIIDRCDKPIELSSAHTQKNSYVCGSTIDIVLWICFAVGLLSMLASALLLFGIKKSKPGLVLYYFGFGIFLTILGLLGALLTLLHQNWIIAIIMFGASLCNIHYLIVVHTFYEALQKGKEFGCNPHNILEEFDDANAADA